MRIPGWIGVLAALLAPAGAEALDLDRARRIARDVAVSMPADDISFDYRASHVRVGDLDGDGRAEIVFMLSATCIGSTADCTNELQVLSTLRPDDVRVSRARIGYDLLVHMDDSTRAVYDSGFWYDASVHVPGRVTRLAFNKRRQVVVTFTAIVRSNLCKTVIGAGSPVARREPCPAPGVHTRVYEWQREGLRLVEPNASGRVRPVTRRQPHGRHAVPRGSLPAMPAPSTVGARDSADACHAKDTP